MIGYRGALRYMREPDLFRLELDAIRQVWDAGHTNLHVMLPFVRTARELAACRALIAEAGLLDPRGVRALGHGRGASVLFNLERYADARRRGHLDRLERPDPAAPRRRPRLRAARRAFDERDPAVADYLRDAHPAGAGASA